MSPSEPNELRASVAAPVSKLSVLGYKGTGKLDLLVQRFSFLVLPIHTPEKLDSNSFKLRRTLFLSHYFLLSGLSKSISACVHEGYTFKLQERTSG